MKKIFTVFEYILFGIISLIPALIIALIYYTKNRIFISKQFKKIKKAGYKISKKNNGKKVYMFTLDSVAIKFSPNEIHDVSFDSGKTYVPIIESNLGTAEEREHLKTLKYQYHTSDHRDQDIYDSTEEFIKFIIKNISPSKQSVNR